jgi:coenzyme F420-reducing hydrogenase beta subunit
MYVDTTRWAERRRWGTVMSKSAKVSELLLQGVHETGLMESERTRPKNAVFLLISASKDMRRHQWAQKSLQTIPYHPL